MFSSLWRREDPSPDSSPDEQAVPRTDASALRFRGELQLESSGADHPDYVTGDPFHRICVYALTDGGYAVVIEFHHEGTCTVDGEVVETLAELDDFLCLHAAERFPQLSAGTDPASTDRERRVLAGYDRQVVDIIRSLGGRSMPSSRATDQQTPPSSRKAKGGGRSPLAPDPGGDPDVG